jgi:hypothetical protein
LFRAATPGLKEKQNSRKEKHFLLMVNFSCPLSQEDAKQFARQTKNQFPDPGRFCRRRQMVDLYQQSGCFQAKKRKNARKIPEKKPKKYVCTIFFADFSRLQQKFV